MSVLPSTTGQQAIDVDAVETQLRPRAPGPLLFARYAYPPNALGYCGDDKASTLLDYASESACDAGLVELARSFDGAWPYLELIAGASNIEDPLSRAVVEAYWLGNPLLDRVKARDFANHLDERFRRRAGRTWDKLRATLPRGALPHHNFHVLCVYPWVGLMRTGAVEHPLQMVDRCRIRWGTVESVASDSAVVRTRRLAWDGHKLAVGPYAAERFTWRASGAGFVEELAPGDVVSLHWDWICDRIPAWQAAQLCYYTRRILTTANSVSGGAAIS
ncbi:MAG: DUF6390 family protein [Gaiellaceae bacterium]